MIFPGSSSLPDLPPSASWGIAGGLLVLALVQTTRLLVAQAKPRWRIKKHRESGARGEKRARKLLQERGYAIVHEQVTGRYELLVDGEPQGVLLRADFLVHKQGRTFIAEVKSGAESARVGNSATRRQLIEYRLAFPVDGILLVDAFAGHIVEIVLPENEGAPRRPRRAPWLLPLALAVGTAVWLLLR